MKRRRPLHFLRRFLTSPTFTSCRSVRARNSDLASRWSGPTLYSEGWKVSAIHRYQSGTPIAVGISEDDEHPGPVYNNAFRPDFTGQAITAQWVGGFKLGPYDPNNPGSTSSYLNPGAFAIPAPFTFGNVPRTLNVRTFAWLNEDVTLAKEIRFAERFNFTFQASAFNVFNRVLAGCLDTGNPGTNLDYGHYTCQGNTPRVLQLSGTLKF